MRPQDGWFLLAIGACFVVFARPYGHALGNALEGPWTQQDRATDVRRHTLVARVVGTGLIVYGAWLLVSS